MKKLFIIIVIFFLCSCAFFYRLGVGVGLEAARLENHNIIYLQGGLSWDRIFELKKVREYLVEGCYREAEVELDNRIEMQEYVLSELVKMGDESLVSRLESEDPEYLEHMMRYQKESGKVWVNLECGPDDDTEPSS